MGLLSTPLSVGTKAVRGLMDMSTSARMQRAEDMGFDTNTNWYHGTNDLENIAKTGFDPSFTGKGNDQFGSGFYFSTRPSQASSFATNLNTNKAGEVQPAGIIKANLALKNPLVVDGTKVSNINELPIDLNSDDVRELLEYSTALKRSLDDEQMNPMGDHFSEFWDDGPTDEMMDKLVDTYTNSNLSAIEGDLFDGNATAFREGLAKVTGYDGIVIDFGDGFKNAVAWKPEQVRSTSAKFDPRKANRGDLIASNPVATATAGAGGLLAISASDDSEAGVVSTSVRIAKEILNLRAQGRASEVTDEMMDAADPQYMFYNTPLPMDEASRLSRANAAGASTDMYHMTDKGFNAFANPSRSGMQGKGVYASSSPEEGMDVPKGLSDLVDKNNLFVQGTNTMPLRFTGESFDESIQRLDPFSDKGTAVLKRFGLKPNKTYSKIKGAEEGRDISEQLYDLARRQATKKHGNQITSEWIEELKSSLNSRLKKAGYASTEDSYTGNKMAFNPENVRSKFARFDPQFSNLKNLSASNPVATTSAGLLANMTGQPSNLASYMQGNTDAYLTAQERAYLNNRQEFDDFFSDDTGYVRADVLPFRTNENTGDSEFATPQMIKGLLSSLYDLGQSPRSGIHNQQSILDLI